ncbi:hypothetical protein [Mycobacterium asiaticum]|uniref:hypothetical protein n=1 Tax=Mycobacterium asiaticum TaxID=1790 RepID=UPI000AEF6209|nr:hypothetical protein [Mycobacterium asiaticum]
MSRLVRFATILLASAGFGFAVLGPGTGVAYADGERHWCPGDDPRGEPGGAFITSPPNWDWNVCHTYYIVPAGQGNVSPGILADAPPPPPPVVCWSLFIPRPC